MARPMIYDIFHSGGAGGVDGAGGLLDYSTQKLDRWMVGRSVKSDVVDFRQNGCSGSD